MTAAEFAPISTNLTVTEAHVTGRVNVLASAAVLACLLEGDVAVAEMLVTMAIQSDELTSIAGWRRLAAELPGSPKLLGARDVLTRKATNSLRMWRPWGHLAADTGA